MFRVFNVGVGMVLIAGERNPQSGVTRFEKTGQKAWIIGEVVEGNKEVAFI